jgi:hypothetical protein
MRVRHIFSHIVTHWIVVLFLCRKVVAVPHPELDKSLVSKADQVLASLEDFDPEFWGLPSFSE